MHLVTSIVLVLAGLATLSLIYYVKIFLPKSIEQSYRESIKAFCTAIELRSPRHLDLCEPVEKYARAVGVRLGLSKRELIDLEMAVYLRDIGLCAVPYSLLSPMSELGWSEEERANYNRHPDISASMLELVPHMRHLAPIVRHHHVQYLSTESVGDVLSSQVPLQSHILSAVTAHCWTARTESSEAAKRRLSSGAGTQFHPRVVEALFAVLPSESVRSANVAVAL